MASLEVYQVGSGLNLSPGWPCRMREGAIIAPNGTGTKQRATGQSHLGLESEQTGGGEAGGWEAGEEATTKDEG